MKLDNIKVSSIKLSEIPCLYIRPNVKKDEVPTIVLYHGWQSSKDRQAFFAKVLAKFGYAVLIPDAINHGDRGSLDYNKIETLKKYFWRTVINSVDEFNTLIKAAINEFNLSSENIGVIGSSMGGFIASGVFALNNNIKCLININGACGWKDVEKKWMEIDGQGLAQEDMIKKVKEYDPINYKDTLYPRPILLLHGDSDSQIPIDTQRYFYNEMYNKYGDLSERLKLFEVPGLNHLKTISMLEEIINWLDRYL